MLDPRQGGAAAAVLADLPFDDLAALQVRRAWGGDSWQAERVASRNSVAYAAPKLWLRGHFACVCKSTNACCN